MNVETAKRIAMAKQDGKKLSVHPYIKADKTNRARANRYWLVVNDEEYEISVTQIIEMGRECISFLAAVAMDRFLTPPPDKPR